MDSFKITNFGPINKVDVQLGDLTILLGPQASGKTLFLQMLKLLVDKDHIVQTLARYNYVTNKQPAQRILSISDGRPKNNWLWKNLIFRRQ